MIQSRFNSVLTCSELFLAFPDQTPCVSYFSIFFHTVLYFMGYLTRQLKTLWKCLNCSLQQQTPDL